jgi:flagellar operon protein
VLDQHRQGPSPPQLELRLSKHARQQLEARQITLAREDLAHIQEMAARAAARGARETLILYEDLALIANLPNQVVKTVIDRQRLRDHVFTQIDSAVVHPGRTSDR